MQLTEWDHPICTKISSAILGTTLKIRSNQLIKTVNFSLQNIKYLWNKKYSIHTFEKLNLVLFFMFVSKHEKIKQTLRIHTSQP